MDTLIGTLVTIMSGYAGRDLNGESFLMRGEDASVLAVVSVGDVPGTHFAMTSLVARVVNRQIVIEHDVNDKPLVEALVEAGVSRSDIVLAYAGETGVNAA